MQSVAGIRSDRLGRYNQCDYLRETGGSMTEERGLDGDSYVLLIKKEQSL
jgi:hypothetical protein